MSITVDPISLVLDTLASGIKPITDEATKDFYKYLKSLLVNKFANNPKGQLALDEYQKDPNDEDFKIMLIKQLKAANVESDSEFIEFLKKKSLQVATGNQNQNVQNLNYSVGNVDQNGNGNFSVGDSLFNTNGDGNNLEYTKGNKFTANDLTIADKVARSFIGKLTIQIPLWQALLLMALSGGIGFGGGAVLENQRINPKLQAAQGQAAKAAQESSEFKQKMSQDQSSLIQDLNALKAQSTASEKKLKETEAKLKETEAKLKNTENQLSKIQSIAATSLSGSWQLKTFPFTCGTQETAGFSRPTGGFCSKTSDEVDTTELIITQTGGNFTVETPSSLNVKSGNVSKNVFVASGYDEKSLFKTILNGKVNNKNDEVSGRLSMYWSGGKVYDVPFTMKRTVT